jgi:hypothetical protein
MARKIAARSASTNGSKADGFVEIKFDTKHLLIFGRLKDLSILPLIST